MWSRSGQRQHNRAAKRKGNKIKPSLQQQPVKMLFVTEGARRAVNKEAEEADEDPHSEVVVRPTLRQIPFRSLSLIKLPMLPKHDGTFFLTSTYRQHWWKRAKGERNVSYCWFSFFVIHRQIASQQQIGHSWKLILRKAQQMAREESIRKRRKMVVKMVKPFLRWGYSRPFLQLTLVHVGLLLILKARAGNLLSLIVSGTMILGWIWRDCHHQYVSWSYQVRLLHTKFLNSTFLILTDQQSIPRWLKNMKVTQRR